MEGASLHASLIGSTIGNYRVVAKIGEGGMGAVYLAEHPLIGKKVALKVLREEYSRNQDIVTRFFHEAKVIHDIGHPNIVDFVDYGVIKTPTGSEFAYFIMEFLAGESLAQLLQREAPLPPQRAFHIGMQVAVALASAHHKRIVHRDLKPDNVFTLQRGRDRDFVKLLDFGIAKLTGEQGGSQQRTRTGVVMGTAAYMSPEQCEGRGRVDHRTDIYALGIVLYEMITGRVPFLGEGYGEVLVQQFTCQPPWPSTIRGPLPLSVEAVVMKALCKKPNERYQTMEEFGDAMRDPDAYVARAGGLEAFLRPFQSTMVPTMAMSVGSVDIPVGPPPPHSSGQTPPYPGMVGPRPTTLTQSSGQVATRTRRHRAPVIAAGAIVVVLALAVGIGYALLPHDKDATNAAGVATAGEPKAESPPEPTAQSPESKPESPSPEPKVQAQPENQAEPKVEAVPVPEPQEIHVQLSSVPAGAEAFVDDKSIGRTPVDVRLPRGEGETEVVLKLEGYVNKTKKISASKDGEYQIALERERVRVRPPARRPVEIKKPPPVEPKKPDPKQPKPPVDDDDVLTPSSQ